MFFADPKAGAYATLAGASEKQHLELASEPILQCLKNFSGASLPDWIDFQVFVAGAFEKAHEDLQGLRTGENPVGKPPLPISATVLLTRENHFQVAHLGAERPLLYSRQFLHPLTKEHTKAFELYEKGKLKVAEVPLHEGANVLTRGLGIDSEDAMMATAAAFKTGTFRPGDRLLLPMGRLLLRFQEEDLLEILSSDSSVEQAAKELTTKSFELGNLQAGCILLQVSADGELSHCEQKTPPHSVPSPSPTSAPSESAASPKEDTTPEDSTSDPANALASSSEPLLEASELESTPIEKDSLGAVADPKRPSLVGGHDLLDDIPAPPPFPPQLAMLLAAQEKSAPASEPSLPPLAEGPEFEELPSPTPSPPPEPAKVTPTLPKEPEAPASEPPVSLTPVRSVRRAVRRRAPAPVIQERWIDTEQVGWLDQSIVVGFALLGAIGAVLRLFWIGLTQG